MPAMTDPMDALRSFQPAFRSKQLAVQKGELDPTIFVHVDRPNGEVRYTYVHTSGNTIIALVILVTAESIEGEPCFSIGYAVPEDRRGQGLSAILAKSAIAELRQGLARYGINAFWVEAVVGLENIASQKVATDVLGELNREGIDEVSSSPALFYVRRFTPIEAI